MKINNNTLQSITALVLGALIFYLLFGFKIVDPTNIAWVMGGDAGQHFLGWHFFRGEPWSFPIGSIQRYHYPEGTTMTFMDSIPLLGIPLKFFNSVLPEHFQYTGIWLLMSYMLQSFFTLLLLRKFTENKIIIFLGASLFVLSTIMLKRAGGHEALAGHWVLLASLYLYFESYNSKTRIKWLLLILATSLIHFYLLFMVLAVWAAYILSYLLISRWYRIILPLSYMLATFSALLLLMWVVGYFTITVSDGGSVGFNLHTMNLLSPVNPIGGGPSLGGLSNEPCGVTTFFREFKAYHRAQYDGYNYLGLGVLLMFVISITNIIPYLRGVNFKKLSPLLFLSILLTFISLSNKITFGDAILFEFNPPFLLDELGRLLRAPGRVFWPVYYILTLFSIVLIIKYHDKKKSIIIITFALIIQVIDFYPWYEYNKSWLDNRRGRTELPSKDLWNKIGNEIDHIVMLPLTKDLNSLLGLYAVENNIDINIGYVARYDKLKRQNYEVKLLEDFCLAKLDKRTLYIIDNDFSYYLPDSTIFSYGILDGYNIIFPKKANLKLNKYSLSPKKILKFNENISFKSDVVEFLGWKSSEAKHRWSMGNSSSILFYLNKQVTKDVMLIIDGWTFSSQKIILYLNNNLVSNQVINNKSELKFLINKAYIKRGGNVLRFEFPEAKVPNQTSTIKIALALKSFKLVEVKPVSLDSSITHNSKIVEYIGWSNPEKSHRWSLGKSSDINILFRKNNSNDIKFTIDGWTLKDIEVNLYVNGNLVKQNKGLSFIIKNSFLNDGENVFHFEFPNARRPNDKEKRVLALALKHFSLTEV